MEDKIINSCSFEYTRIFNNNWPTLNYNNYDKINFRACHWGQKKLLLSEIEFFSIVLKKEKTFDNFICVYIGASPGEHINILSDMFNSLYFLLYDPVQSMVVKSDKNQIFKKMFTNDDVFYIKNNYPDKEILFISDIRSETENKDVIKNLISQQEWGINLNAKYMLLKFRLPFYNKDEYYNYDISNIKSKIYSLKNNIGEKINEFFYLDGKIYLQAFKPLFSTESRLFVKRLKSNKYKFTTYNNKNYEGKMLFFNEYEINKNYKISSKLNLFEQILGYDNKYDYVTEYYIIKEYLKIHNFKTNPSSILNKIHTINICLFQLTNYNFMFCEVITLLKYLKKNKWEKNYIKYVKKNIDNYENEFFEQIINQINIIKNKSLLNKDEINLQIQLFNMKKEFIIDNFNKIKKL